MLASATHFQHQQQQEHHHHHQQQQQYSVNDYSTPILLRRPA